MAYVLLTAISIAICVTCLARSIDELAKLKKMERQIESLEEYVNNLICMEDNLK